MSVPRVRGVKILKAVSSPLRLQLLNLLFDKGMLSYTELMSSLKMNPTRDAGRFAYHLKFLLKADLIEADAEAKKYCLTELGKMVIEIADRIDKKALKPKRMLVRTSRFALEDFDANKIANSLVREARMSADLAQRVAKEAERQLLKSKTKYLTAPLVREIVNAILIQKGMEEYRHKLTRLGIPVHDVKGLIEQRNQETRNPDPVQQAAGETIFKEYTLLNMFPRDISDAHLSGALHINGIGSWTLRPTEVIHDVRFFLQNGLNMEQTCVRMSSLPPPQSLEAALSTILNVVLHCSKEIEGVQTLEYFNVFLAPFVKETESSRIKEILRLFIFNLSQHADVSVGLELAVPDFLVDKPATGFSGKTSGTFGDYADMCQLLASLFIEILAEESACKPFFNPVTIIKTRENTFTNEGSKALFLKAHSVASNCGIPYFANLLVDEGKYSVFSRTGFRIDIDQHGDWEVDALRTGCLGVVTINMPRIAYESGKDKARFFETMRERLEMANRALEIKYRALRQHSQSLLPLLMQKANGDSYFRLDTCSRLVNLAGLREATEAFCERKFGDEKTVGFIEEIAHNLRSLSKAGRRGRNVFPSTLHVSEASERLAQLDLERYGIAKIRYSGTRERIFYSVLDKTSFRNNAPVQELHAGEHHVRELQVGGGLTVIELGEGNCNTSELAAATKQTFESLGTRFLVYDRKFTYCLNCRKSWFGRLSKCPNCGAVGTLVFFDRFSST